MRISRTKKNKIDLPRTDAEKEQVRIKEFLDMCSPSVLKFYPDYYICGGTYRSVWAIREYPTDTDEQAILRHLGDRSGVTLRDIHKTRYTGRRKENHFKRRQPEPNEPRLRRYSKGNRG